MEKIKFKDLDVWLRVAIIIAWFDGVIYAISFLIGFLEGFFL